MMEMSVRFKDLEEALLSVFTDRLFNHDDSDSLAAMEHAGAEFLLNYEGGGVQDRLGSMSASEVDALVSLARRLHEGEDGAGMQDGLRNFLRRNLLRPVMDSDLHDIHC